MKIGINLLPIMMLLVGCSPQPPLQAPSQAVNVYYVATSGKDSNPGTLTQPWRTIQKAAQHMTAGDTVFVSAGDYSAQRVNIAKSGASGSPIAYRAQGQVVMKGFHVVADYIIIDGFEIANTDYRRWNSQTSAGIYIKGAHNIVENSYIHDASLEGIHLYGPPDNATITHDNIVRNNKLFRNEMVGINVNGRNNLVEGNEVWGTVQCLPAVTKVEGSCISGLDADGIRFFGQGHIFRNNYIHDILYGPPGIDPTIGDYNDNPHIDCFQTWSDSYNEAAQNILFEQNKCVNLQSQTLDENGTGWMLSAASNLTIRNNIISAYAGIDGNMTSVSGLNIYNNLWINNLSFTRWYPKGIGLNNTPGVTIKNNIFYNQPALIIDGSAPGLIIDHNLAFKTSGSYSCNIGENSLCNVDPLFVDPANGDFHLQAGSLAIDAGYNLGTSGINDFDGVSRPQGAGYDIGPYEYNNALSTSNSQKNPFQLAHKLSLKGQLILSYNHLAGKYFAHPDNP